MGAFRRTAFTLLAALAVAPALEAQEIPVYRWYNSANDWHLYTANAGERPGGWAPEAVVFRVFAAGTPGTVPLYRLQRSDGGHFYTTDGPELAAVRARGWQVEGLLGHVASQPRAGTVALHRFLKGNGRHFYTTDQREGAAAGFRYEGVIGYVPDGDDAAARERLAAAERQRAEEEARQRQAQAEQEARRRAEEEARRREEEAAAAAAQAAASGAYNVAITTATGMCLIPAADRPGATVYVRPCSEGGAMYRIENGYVVTPGGNCFGPAGWGLLVVQLSGCRPGRPDGTPQQWYFHGNKLAQNAARSSLCMDVEGGSRQAGARVLAYECRDYQRPVENQRFSLGGAFRLGVWALQHMPEAARHAVTVENGAVLFDNGTLLIAAGGGRVIAAGGGNVIAAGGGNVIAAGGGNVIAPGGGNLRVIANPANLIRGASVIASGGGNVIAAGGGNVIAPGGGNVIAPGGGN